MNNDLEKPDFKYPFSDLFIWSILTKRQDMAFCMWEHGEEAMAKVNNFIYFYFLLILNDIYFFRH